MIEQLPKHTSIQLQLDHSCTYPLPFIWAGFRVTPNFSYRIEGIGDEKDLWSGLRENIRTDIKKAQKLVTVSDFYVVGCIDQPPE